MDFAFSEEHEMLRSSAQSWLGERMPEERVAELADSDEGWDPGSWSEIAELGWTGLSIPEESGGSGMGFLAEAIIFEELGRSLYPGPYLSTIALALPSLRFDPAAVKEVATGASTATLAWAEPGEATYMGDPPSTSASESNGEWTLSGTKHLIPDVGIVDRAVVTASDRRGPGLWLVSLDGRGVERTVSRTVDGTRRLGTLVLDAAPAALLVGPESYTDVLEETRIRALVACALESVGIASHVLSLSTAYVSERKQFDKPIGAYQAVSHQLSNTYMETELARSLSYWAAWSLDAEDDNRAIAAAAAKSAAGETAVHACERAIQVHGGIGFTWEHILHRYYRRAQWLDSFEGFGAPQRAAVAAHLLDD